MLFYMPYGHLRVFLTTCFLIPYFLTTCFLTTCLIRCRVSNQYVTLSDDCRDATPVTGVPPYVVSCGSYTAPEGTVSTTCKTGYCTTPNNPYCQNVSTMLCCVLFFYLCVIECNMVFCTIIVLVFKCKLVFKASLVFE